MRLINVVMGSKTSTDRNAEISAMLDYGFAQYSVETVLTKKSILGITEVDKGYKRYVEVVPLEDITFLNKKIDKKKNFSYKIKMDKVKAPLDIKDKIGTIYIYEDNNKVREVTLTVNESVKKANIIRIYFRYLGDIITGKIEL